MVSSILVTVAATLFFGLISAQRTWTPGQAVKTTSGEVVGMPSPKFPTISSYMGIPFAQPPLGPLRFAPPVALNSSATIQAKSQGPTCPGTISMMSFGNISEDCLYLNIWAKPQTGEASKAVMFFVYGGGFETGSNFGMDGSKLVETQDVIVVMPGYRLGIYGFPDAPLEDKNVGILDIRKAVEWTRDNIAQFGGDPKRIMMFGQSAGSMLCDIYSMAFDRDPIVNGFIGESGTANTPFLSTAGGSKNWYLAAQGAGCNETGMASVNCMRTKTQAEVSKAVSSVKRPTGLVPPFAPTNDEKVFWTTAEVNNRARQSYFAKVPHVFVVNANDGVVQSITSSIFDCPSSMQAAKVAAHGIKTWRVRFYAGGTGSSAVHGAEMAYVFGWSNSPLASLVMSTWAAFAKDPENSLDKLGWVPYTPGGQIVRLGYRNETRATTEPSTGPGGVDTPCGPLL